MMMEKHLFQKVYISSARADITQADIEDILAASLRHNAAAGITGLLMFHEGSFLQVLEGPQEALNTCYARIERDARHRQLIPMLEIRAQARSFPEWRMGFKQPEDLSEGLKQAALSLYDIYDEGHDIGRDQSKIRRLVTSFLWSFRSIQA